MSENVAKNTSIDVAKALLAKIFPADSGRVDQQVVVERLSKAIDDLGLMRPEDRPVKHDDKILNLSRLNENEAVVVIRMHPGGISVSTFGDLDVFDKFKHELIGDAAKPDLDPEGSFTLKGRRNGDLWEVTPYGDMIAFDDWKQFLIDMTPVDLCPENVGMIRVELLKDGSWMHSEIGNFEAITEYKSSMFGKEYMKQVVEDFENHDVGDTPESELDQTKRKLDEANQIIADYEYEGEDLLNRLRTAEILEHFWRKQAAVARAHAAEQRDRMVEMGGLIDSLTGRTPF